MGLESNGDQLGRARVRVALLHAHEIARQGLGAMLYAIPRIEIVCSTAQPEIARIAIQALEPDVLLISTGMDLAGALDPDRTTPRVLGLVPSDGADHLTLAARMEAHGYAIESTLTVDVLAGAIEGVADRRPVLPSELSDFLLARARSKTDVVPLRVGLTPRERQTLVLLADGLSNKEVARRLGISENGAKRHVASILSKLNTPSRAGAVAIALTERMIQPGPMEEPARF